MSNTEAEAVEHEDEQNEGPGCEDCGYTTNSCQCPVDVGMALRLIHARQAKAVRS